MAKTIISMVKKLVIKQKGKACSMGTPKIERRNNKTSKRKG